MTVSRETAKTDGNAGDPHNTMWFLQSSFATQFAFEAFNHSLSPFRAELSQNYSIHQWRGISDAARDFDEDYVNDFSLANIDENDILNCWPLKELDSTSERAGLKARSDGNASALAVRDSPFLLDVYLSSCLQQLLERVAPVLVSTFLDCAPSVFSLSGPRTSPTTSVNVGLVDAVGKIARILYGVVLSQASEFSDAVSMIISTLFSSALKALTYNPGAQYCGKAANTVAIYVYILSF